MIYGGCESDGIDLWGSDVFGICLVCSFFNILVAIGASSGAKLVDDENK